MSKQLKKLFENFFEEYMVLNPNTATFIGINKYNHIYPNYLSQQKLEQYKKFDKKYLNLLTSINKDKLSEKEKHHMELLQYRLENFLESYKYPTELLPIDQFSNFIIDYVELASGKSYLPLKT